MKFSGRVGKKILQQMQCSMVLSALWYVRKGKKSDVDTCNTSLNIAVAWVWGHVVTHSFSALALITPQKWGSHGTMWSSWFCSHCTHCCAGTRSDDTVLTLNNWPHLCTGHTWDNISVQRFEWLSPKATESTICAVGHTNTHTPRSPLGGSDANVHQPL